MKILVTGGAGYLGTHLVPMLLEKGYQVRLFDAFNWGLRPILHFAAHPLLEIQTGDVRNREQVRDAMKGCDVVMHLAAIVGYPACAADPDRAYSTNVLGTKNIVEELGGRRLIFASTGSTYGKVEGICTEETPIAPLTLYGSTKWEAEQMVRDKNGVGLRLATVFGVSPRLRLDLLVNDFTYQALANRQIILYEGHFRRSFLHCVDAARAFVFALENYDRMAGEAVNVGDESMNYTKKEVALEIAKHVDYYLHEAPVGEDLDKRDYEVSYAKIRGLGFSIQTRLAEGIQELIKVLRHLRLRDEWRNA